MSADKMPPLPEAYHASEWEHEMFTGYQTHAYARAYAAEQTRELVEALGLLLEFPSGQYSEADGWDEAFDRARALIAKHKEQA